MRIISKVYLLVLALVLSGTAAAAQSKAAAPLVPRRTIIISAGDDMKFSPTELIAKPGEILKIRLLAIGTQPTATMRHNFVLLKAGANQIDFVEAAAKAQATDYIPAAPALKSLIVAQTKLVENGQSAEVIFAVPTKPGNYPYFCTFPGHMAAGARGKLIVK